MNKSLNYKVSSAWRLLYQHDYTPFTFGSKTARFARTQCQLCIYTDSATDIRASSHGLLRCNKDLPRNDLLGWHLDVISCSRCDCTTTLKSQICPQSFGSFHIQDTCRFPKRCVVHPFSEQAGSFAMLQLSKTQQLQSACNRALAGKQHSTVSAR
jgi:hypothetical protein